LGSETRRRCRAASSTRWPWCWRHRSLRYRSIGWPSTRAASFGYDDFGNLASATAGASAVTYASNGDGLRVSATSGGSSASYLWDQAAGLPSLLSDGTSGFLSADATLLAETSASSSAYPITDALGSVRGLTDSSGSLSASASYDVFGSVRSSSGSVGSLGYTGALSDSSGLVYLQARSLDPASGTFTSRDPLTPGGPGITGFNPYAYAGQNPTTYSDPSGAMALGEAGARGLVVTGNAALVAEVGWTVTMLLARIGLRLLWAQLLEAAPGAVPWPWGGESPSRPRPGERSGDLTWEDATAALRGAVAARGISLTDEQARDLTDACRRSALTWLLGGGPSACAGGTGFPVVFYGALGYLGTGPLAQTTRHIHDSLTVHAYWAVLHYMKRTEDRNDWYYTMGGCLKMADKVCDEFPFWSTEEGYRGPRMTAIPSTRLVDRAEAWPQAILQGRLTAAVGGKSSTGYGVLPLVLNGRVLPLPSWVSNG
jgi:RHS repeat-associated protein